MVPAGLSCSAGTSTNEWLPKRRADPRRAPVRGKAGVHFSSPSSPVVACLGGISGSSPGSPRDPLQRYSMSAPRGISWPAGTIIASPARRASSRRLLLGSGRSSRRTRSRTTCSASGSPRRFVESGQCVAGELQRFDHGAPEGLNPPGQHVLLLHREPVHQSDGPARCTAPGDYRARQAVARGLGGLRVRVVGGKPSLRMRSRASASLGSVGHRNEDCSRFTAHYNWVMDSPSPPQPTRNTR